MNKVLAGALTAVFVAASASASTIGLDENKGWTSGSHTYSGGGYSVEVSAWQYSSPYYDSGAGDWVGKLTSDASKLASWTPNWWGQGGGAGVKGPHECSWGWCYGDKHTVDGKKGNDLVLFDFGSKMVELTSITFSYADWHDKFDVFVFGNGASVGSYSTDSQTDIGIYGSGTKTVNIAGLATGSLFGIGAWDSHASFKVKALHFSELTAVPLPAAGWLLLGSLGGLVALKRRRRAA